MRLGRNRRTITGPLALTALAVFLCMPFGAAQSQVRYGENSVIAPESVVALENLPPIGESVRTPVRVRPRLYPDLAQFEREKAAANADTTSSETALAGGPGELSVASLTTFQGLQHSESGGYVPPDNGTAAGPSHIMQFVNVAGAIFNKSTGARLKSFGLETFFNTTQELTDPLVRFDPGSGRWFAAIVTTDVPLRWILAVSASSDPTGSFVIYSFTPDPTRNNNSPDFPNMGISDDKVVLTGNAFNAAGTSYLGAEFVVFNKAELVAGSSVHTTLFGPDLAAFTLRAAVNLSSDANIYMTAYPGSGTTIRVYTVTGLPTATSTASSSFLSRTIRSIPMPPDAQQSGGSPLIQTNDNRLLDAAFRDGSLFTTGTSGCTPPGDTSLRACLRVVEVLSPGTLATVNQDFDSGLGGIYLYYPALAITSAGDVISTFSRSSSSEFVGVWATGRLGTDPLNSYQQPPILVKAGEAHYGPFANRWGDYSAVAIDPSDQSKVWGSGEYACPGGCANGSNWGTWIAQLSLRPTIAPRPPRIPGFPADYFGDGKTDIAVYRPATGVWYILNPATSAVVSTQWGGADDVAVPGDYDGDNKDDVAVYHPATGVWYILQSRDGTIRTVQWGWSTDIPVPGDYDGDAKADIAVYRPSTGVWYVIRSGTGGGTTQQWGWAEDRPVPGDYDGDRRTDVAVYRPSTGVWYIVNSSNGLARAVQWGWPTDVPVPGDYDGDGKTDIAVYRPATGTWYIVNSSNGSARAVQWGWSTDIPVPGDYDGDGKTDIAVYRPSTGGWYIMQSSNGAIRTIQWGWPTDLPVPGWF